MRFLHNQPIKRKVTLVIMLITGAALGLACTSLFVFRLVKFRQNYAHDLSVLGQIIASHSAAPLTFKDAQSAEDLLAALRVKPNITDAQLRWKDGTLFAKYGDEAEWNPPPSAGIRSEGSHLIYSEPIMLDQEQIGFLHLRSDYKTELRGLLRDYLLVLSIVLISSTLLTAFLTARLQRVISRPILSLAETAKIVAARKDYSLRATKLEEDEIGQFTEAFNQMLEQIQTRDSALRLSQQKFETIVNSIEGVVWEADPESLQFTFVSRQAERFLGYPQDQWLSNANFWSERLHPEDRDRVLQEFRRALAEKRPCSQECRLLAMDESVLWVRSYSTAVLDGDRPVLLRGVLLDVTKEKKAAEELALQAQLVTASRQAGMAEVATGVLHNVGNVLNSVNVSATLVCDHMRKAEVDTLAKLAALLRQHEADLPIFLTTDPKGKLIPDFLQRLCGQLTEQWRAAFRELELVAKNIEHIKEIVAMQQSYAKVSGVLETLPVAQMVEDALQINAAGFKRHGVEVIRQFEPVPPVTVDRHKVLQILINLFRNAKYAMDQAAVQQRKLTLRVELNGHSRAKISVRDNGVGIARENLTRVFSLGFTTKKEGHGFGLHASALAAKEMGGALYAHSDGLGNGATFTLELPLANDRRKA